MVCVKHFLKHNDDTRLDAVRIIKSFAFQLALQLPAVAEYILGLDVKTVDQLRNMGDAYDYLINIPLIADQQVIILIDALDEGDPQEQQRADYDYKLHGIEPVGNKVTHCFYGSMYDNRLTQSQSSVINCDHNRDRNRNRNSNSNPYPDPKPTPKPTPTLTLTIILALSLIGPHDTNSK